MLTTSAKTTDCQLEPNDKTKFVITITNTSSTAVAKDVIASPRLHGSAKGIEMSPKQVSFGSIGPRATVTKELEICTSNAVPKRYRVLFPLKYSCEIPKQECDQAFFNVVKD